MSKKRPLESKSEESDSDDNYEYESEDKSEEESEKEDSPERETKPYDDWLYDFRDELIFEFIKHFGDRPIYGSFRSTMENFCTTLSDWEKSNPIPE